MTPDLDIIKTLQSYWWLIGALVAIFTAVFRAAKKADKAAMSIGKIEDHGKAIADLDRRMVTVEKNTEKISNDMTMVLSALSDIHAALRDKNCAVGDSEKKLQAYIIDRGRF